MSSLFPPMSKSIQSPSFPNNSLNFHQSMGQSSQPNSPADSAIGTASESIQSPPLDANAQRQKSTQISAQFSQPSTSESQQPPRPPKKLSTRPKNGQISISLPIREKIVCQRDFERIVKETEILRGTKGTSQEQLMAESKLSREWLNEPDKNINNNNDRVEESRKYYYFDPIRHEYRLYYSREVRLRSETNLSAIGLDIELRGMKANQNEEKTTMSPLRRRHSAGAGHLRRAVPPPKNAFSNGNGGNGLGQLAQQNATRFTAVENNELKMEGTNGNVGGFGGERQINAENEPKTMRRGAFERNSTSRKPFQLRSVSDPPRRRQWSGGAKRAALLKQQQQELLEQQKRMGTELGIGQNRPIPAIRQNQIVPKTNEKGEKERIGNENWQKSLNGIGGMNSINSPPTVTNQMLKQLLRPLHKNEDFGWHSDDQNIKKWATGGGDYDKEALLGSPSPSQQKQQMMAIDTDNSMDRKKGKKGRRSIWNCFRMKGKAKNEEDGKNRRKTLPESGRPPNARLQRYMAFLLVPLFLLVAAAAIAIVVIIWYI